MVSVRINVKKEKRGLEEDLRLGSLSEKLRFLSNK
jgi:hypothetical protein